MFDLKCSVCFFDFQFNSTTHELIPGGSEVPVTPQNIYCYIRKYAQYKMVKSCEKALEVGKYKSYINGYNISYANAEWIMNTYIGVPGEKSTL